MKRTIPNEICDENGELQQTQKNANGGKDENSCGIQYWMQGFAEYLKMKNVFKN